jgi:hypothetical protein
MSLFLSIPAFLGFVIALAVLARAGPHATDSPSGPVETATGGERGGRRVFCGGGCALAAFLFIPPAGLPPLCDTAWGGAASLALLGLGLVCLRAGTTLFAAWTTLAASGALLAVYADVLGLQGGMFSLGTFASCPLWEIAGGWGRVGLVCFLLAVVRTGSGLRGLARENLAGQVWGLGFSAVVVCLFLPWFLAGHAASLSLPVAAADFCLFWVKVLLLLRGIPPAGRIAALPWPALWLAGAAGMYADIAFGPPSPVPCF